MGKSTRSTLTTTRRAGGGGARGDAARGQRADCAPARRSTRARFRSAPLRAADSVQRHRQACRLVVCRRRRRRRGACSRWSCTGQRDCGRRTRPGWWSTGTERTKRVGRVGGGRCAHQQRAAACCRRRTRCSCGCRTRGGPPDSPCRARVWDLSGHRSAALAGDGWCEWTAGSAEDHTRGHAPGSSGRRRLGIRCQ